jgi:hypothetical protein
MHEQPHPDWHNTIQKGPSTMKRHLVLAGLTVLLGVAACSHNQTPASTSTTTTPTTSSPASNKSDYPAKSYDLGHSVIYKQAFWQFTGTGTPWQKACESVVGEWQAAVGTQPWWNRDDAMRGCIDAGGGPASASTPPKECPAQDGNQIKVYSGDIACPDAAVLARRYDMQGPKFQQIDSVDTWTCVSGVADTRPLLFTCSSDKGVEFGVYPAP